MATAAELYTRGRTALQQRAYTRAAAEIPKQEQVLQARADFATNESEIDKLIAKYSTGGGKVIKENGKIIVEKQYTEVLNQKTGQTEVRTYPAVTIEYDPSTNRLKKVSQVSAYARDGGRYNEVNDYWQTYDQYGQPLEMHQLEVSGGRIIRNIHKNFQTGQERNERNIEYNPNKQTPSAPKGTVTRTKPDGTEQYFDPQAGQWKTTYQPATGGVVLYETKGSMGGKYVSPNKEFIQQKGMEYEQRLWERAAPVFSKQYEKQGYTLMSTKDGIVATSIQPQTLNTNIVTTDDKNGFYTSTNNGNRNSIGDTQLPSLEKETYLESFGRRTEALEKRQQQFYGSEGFKRIEKVASIITDPQSWFSGVYKPIEKRGIVGRTAGEVLTGIMSFPISLGGYIPATVEKLELTGEAIAYPETRGNILPELKRAGMETLQIYTKPSTYVTAAIFALPQAASMVAAGKPVVRVQTGNIAGVKTTIISTPKGGSPAQFGFLTKSGNRAFIISKGTGTVRGTASTVPALYTESALTTARITQTTAPPIAPFGTTQFMPEGFMALKKAEARSDLIKTATQQTVGEIVSGKVQLTPDSSATVRKLFRKEIIGKRSITPLDTTPKGAFGNIVIAEKPPIILTKALTPKQARKATVKYFKWQGEQAILRTGKLPARFDTRDLLTQRLDIVKAEAKPQNVFIEKIPSSKKQRRLIRQEIIGKRSIKPLDITPQGAFAAELPLYQSPSYYKQKAKELGLFRTQTAIPLWKVMFPRNFLQTIKQPKITYAQKPVKLLTMGKTSYLEPKGYTESIIKLAKQKIIEGMFGRDKIIIIQSVKPTTSEIFRARKPEVIKKNPLEVEAGKEGSVQILKLEKPILEKPKTTTRTKQFQMQGSKTGGQKTEQILLQKQENISKTKTIGGKKATLDDVFAKSKLKLDQINLSKQTPFVGLVNLQKQISGQKSISKQKQSLKTKQIQIQKQQQIGKQIQVSNQAQEQLLGSLQLSAQASIQDQVSLQDSLNIQDTIQGQEQLQDQAQNQIQRDITDETFREEPPDEIIWRPTPDNQFLTPSIKAAARQQAYDVLIKAKQQKLKKGKYKSRGYTKANDKPLTRDAALGLGMEITDTYANRSFKIKKSNKQPIDDQRLAMLKNRLAYKFRTQKKNPNVLVEKETHAIDSREELLKITYEGLKAIKRKKAMASLIQKGRVKRRNTPSEFLDIRGKPTRKTKRVKQQAWL